MELRHLRYFTTLAETLHFGRAAARLGISQPPLSQQIMALEQELGVALFQRGTRHVRLTEAGQLFLPEAQRTLEQAERSRRVAEGAARGEQGELRLGLFGSAPLSPVVAATIAAFRRDLPAARLTLREMTSAQQLSALVEQRLDCGFLRSPVFPALPPGFAAVAAGKEALCALMPPAHPLAASAAPLPVAALRDEALVFFDRSIQSTLHEQVHALCAEAGFSPRIAQVANSNSMILGLVVAGLGVSVLPEALCRMLAPSLHFRRLSTQRPGAADTGLWFTYPALAEAGGAPLAAQFLARLRGVLPGLLANAAPNAIPNAISG